jgi:hypothetical protein
MSCNLLKPFVDRCIKILFSAPSTDPCGDTIHIDSVAFKKESDSHAAMFDLSPAKLALLIINHICSLSLFYKISRNDQQDSRCKKAAYCRRLTAMRSLTYDFITGSAGIARPSSSYLTCEDNPFQINRFQHIFRHLFIGMRTNAIPLLTDGPPHRCNMRIL